METCGGKCEREVVETKINVLSKNELQKTAKEYDLNTDEKTLSSLVIFFKLVGHRI